MENYAEIVNEKKPCLPFFTSNITHNQKCPKCKSGIFINSKRCNKENNGINNYHREAFCLNCRKEFVSVTKEKFYCFWGFFKYKSKERRDLAY